MKSRYAISRSDLDRPLCGSGDPIECQKDPETRDSYGSIRGRSGGFAGRVSRSRRVVDREIGVFEDKEIASLGIAIGDIPTVT
jgi:hypothetical protein